MDEVLAIVSAVVAVLGTTVGAVVAIDQLTLRSRQKRLMALTREIHEVEVNPDRRDILEHIYLNVAGRIVAATMVPARRFVPSAYWIVASMMISAGLGYFKPSIVVWIVAGVISVLLTSMASEKIMQLYRMRNITFCRYVVCPDRIQMPDLKLTFSFDDWLAPKFIHAVFAGSGFFMIAVSVGIWISIWKESFDPPGWASFWLPMLFMFGISTVNTARHYAWHFGYKEDAELISSQKKSKESADVASVDKDES